MTTFYHFHANYDGVGGHFGFFKIPPHESVAQPLKIVTLLGLYEYQSSKRVFIIYPPNPHDFTRSGGIST